MEASKTDRFEHLYWTIGGMLAGAWWVKNQIDEKQQSRSERDYPDEIAEVCEEIGEVLNSWEPDPGCETENDFVHDLAAYLEDETERVLTPPSNCPEIAGEDCTGPLPFSLPLD